MIRRLLVFAAALLPLLSQEQKDTTKLAPYYPTPETVVERMLKLGGLKPGEKMYDLGSGDGRVVIMAADKFKADSTGIEYDADLWKQSSDRIKALGLEKRARIIHGDITKQDFSAANMLTVYLLPSSNDKIRPMLEKQLKPGTRIVAHDFMFQGWAPVKEEHVEDDGEGRSHTLYLYVR
jgi:16S rRNA A1518/A1519 N6-dimethyltransferase RsmA/KsgA/DIM1 with predicted DNA glycosylase/AP lyase activity